MSNRLLCISYRFPPQTYALAIRVKYVLNHLRQNGWTIDAVTAAPDATSKGNLTVHHVPSWTPTRLFQEMKRLNLKKVLDLLVWPDPYVFWVLPAYWKAQRLLQHHSYDAVLVFMMPYSTGLVGLLVRQETERPLVFNLNDSPTCSDMNPTHPTPLHYRGSKRLEDRFVEAGDAVIYVSERNLERVRRRQPPEQRDSFHLIRRGAPPMPDPGTPPRQRPDVHISYVGGTGGWYKFLNDNRSPSALKRLYRTWQELGADVRANLDHRTHSPIYVGRAVRRVVEQHPEWRGRIHVDVYGKRYSREVTDAVLSKFDLHDIVTLHGPVPHRKALQKMVESDLLFMALPDRPDGSPGGRISAKTYEYLSTDRPILAALPPGENREYLQDKPGVHLTDPDDVEAMTEVVREVTTAKFDGSPISVDRSALRPSLSSTARAQAFEDLLSDLVPTARPVLQR